VIIFSGTSGPSFMCEIGTQKIGSNIMNLHIKRPRITVNLRIRSSKMAISQSHLRKIADKKVAYNEGCLYIHTTHIFKKQLILQILHVPNPNMGYFFNHNCVVTLIINYYFSSLECK